jgi:hypothetical protein
MIAIDDARIFQTARDTGGETPHLSNPLPDRIEVPRLPGLLLPVYARGYLRGAPGERFRMWARVLSPAGKVLVYTVVADDTLNEDGRGRIVFELGPVVVNTAGRYRVELIPSSGRPVTLPFSVAVVNSPPSWSLPTRATG